MPEIRMPISNNLIKSNYNGKNKNTKDIGKSIIGCQIPENIEKVCN